MGMVDVSRIKISAFRWVPPQVQGLVRDLRVRWALEEAQLPYDERLKRCEALMPADPAAQAHEADATRTGRLAAKHRVFRDDYLALMA